jgi:hypothetical protein
MTRNAYKLVPDLLLHPKKKNVCKKIKKAKIK